MIVKSVHQNYRAEFMKPFTCYSLIPEPCTPAKEKFYQGRHSIIKLTIFDAPGRQVETITPGILPAGRYETDRTASRYSNGIYFGRLIADTYSDTGKMILTK